MTNDGIAALGYFYNLNDPTAALIHMGGSLEAYIFF
jgi:hypothetical protein